MAPNPQTSHAQRASPIGNLWNRLSEGHYPSGCGWPHERVISSFSSSAPLILKTQIVSPSDNCFSSAFGRPSSPCVPPPNLPSSLLSLGRDRMVPGEARWLRRLVPAILLRRRGGGCHPCRLARSRARAAILLGRTAAPRSAAPVPRALAQCLPAPGRTALWPLMTHAVSKRLSSFPPAWLASRKLIGQDSRAAQPLRHRERVFNPLRFATAEINLNWLPNADKDGPAMTESYLTACTCSAWSFPQNLSTFVTRRDAERTPESNQRGLDVGRACLLVCAAPAHCCLPGGDAGQRQALCGRASREGAGDGPRSSAAGQLPTSGDRGKTSDLAAIPLLSRPCPEALSRLFQPL